jgi:4-amino-4-deoxy-L-arabinose transferase-like glycosyltransferase
VVVAFFTAASTKLPTYVLPAFPPLALAVGALAAWVRAGRPVRLAGLSWGLTLAPAAALPVLLYAALATRAPGHEALALVAAPFLLAGLLGGLMHLERRPTGALRVAGLLAALGLLLLHLVLVPALEPLRAGPALGREAAARARPGDVLGTFRYARPSLVFYGGVPNRRLAGPEAVASFLDLPEGRLLAAPRAGLAALPVGVRVRLEVVASSPDAFDAGEEMVLAVRREAP